jgi:molybdopterin converting factor small subunit
MAVTVRFWAAARAASGVAEDEYDDPTSLASLLQEVGARHGPALVRVLGVASFLIDSAPVGRRDPSAVLVPSGSVVEVLPPFAGG